MAENDLIKCPYFSKGSKKTTQIMNNVEILMDNGISTRDIHYMVESKYNLRLHIKTVELWVSDLKYSRQMKKDQEYMIHCRGEYQEPNTEIDYELEALFKLGDSTLKSFN